MSDRSRNRIEATESSERKYDTGKEPKGDRRGSACRCKKKNYEADILCRRRFSWKPHAANTHWVKRWFNATTDAMSSVRSSAQRLLKLWIAAADDLLMAPSKRDESVSIWWDGSNLLQSDFWNTATKVPNREKERAWQLFMARLTRVRPFSVLDLE